MRKRKIVFIGAGSVVFAKSLLADILWHDELKDVTIHLVDINAERLQVAERMTRIINRQLGARADIRASLDRRAALDGADFVMNAINAGGSAARRKDLRLAARFGLKQVVGDTVGAGGVFLGLRTIPQLLAIASDMEKRCPDAWLFNYSNPMAMTCLALARATRARNVGLCHGVQATAKVMRMMVALLDEPVGAIRRHFRRPLPARCTEWAEWLERGSDPCLEYACAGINHMAFFLRFTSGGRDLYPDLRRALDRPEMSLLDPVRMELFRRLGCYMTESSGHMSEYVPYFLKSPKEIRRLRLRPLNAIQTTRALEQRYRALRSVVRADKDVLPRPYAPSPEYVSRIIHAMVTGRPFAFNGNVHNRGAALIGNLPGDSCVETPCIADRRGIHPIPVGDLPPQCAALICPNIAVQDLAVRGILEGSRQAICQAIMMDPNTASQLTLPQIDRLVEALFQAHAADLPPGMK